MAWLRGNKIRFPLKFSDVLNNQFYSDNQNYVSFIKEWEKTFPIRSEKNGFEFNPAVNLMSYFTAYVYFRLLQFFYFNRHVLPAKTDSRYSVFSWGKNASDNVYVEDWKSESLWQLHLAESVSINSVPTVYFTFAWVHSWYTLGAIWSTGKEDPVKSRFSEYFRLARENNADIFYTFFNEVAKTSVTLCLAALHRFMHLWSSIQLNNNTLREIKKSGAAEPFFFITTPYTSDDLESAEIPRFLREHCKDFSRKDSAGIKAFGECVGAGADLESFEGIPGFTHVLFKDFGNSLGPTPEDSGFENFCFHKSDYFNGLCFLDFACFIELFYDIDGLHPEDS